MALDGLAKLGNKYTEMDLRLSGEGEARLMLKDMGFNSLQANVLTEEDELLDEFLDNPYSFIGSLPGFSLKDADALRQYFNPAEEELAESGHLPARDEGMVLNYLHNYTRPQRESYADAGLLVDRLVKDGMTGERVDHALDSLLDKDRICLREFEGERQVFLYESDRDEEIIAEKIAKMLARPDAYNKAEINILVRSMAEKTHFKLTEEQSRAVESAFKNSVSIVTGGPGTGKTSIIQVIYDLLDQAGEEVDLCAFTGRAAKRIHEATGLNAKTIHRLLEATYDEETHNTFFARDADNKLDLDAIIIDEASMVGLDLFARLLEALSDRVRLIIVGDEKQLPPVNSGCVFKEVIKSGLVPVQELTEVHRQKEGSEILDFSHRIRQLDDRDPGKLILQDLGKTYGRDLIFIEKISNTEVAGEILKIMESFFRDSDLGWEDILMNSQVILPMRKPSPGDGGLNTLEMNKKIQAVFNPSQEKPALSDNTGKITFKLDDKVIHVKNNYSLPIYDDDGEEYDSGVFNGEVGMVTDVDPEEGLTVRYDRDRNVAYDFTNLEELDLAYALTVHKAQGSEIDRVIFALPTKISRFNRMLLQRNLFYTGLTRAKNKAWLIGSKNSLASAIKMTDKDWKSCISARLREKISLDK